MMIDGVKSMSKDLNWGAPQGSVLGLHFILVVHLAR